MSLIDEALKRAELEAARRDGLKTGASPWAMETRARGRRWPIFAAAFLLLAAAAGAIFWLTRRVPAPSNSQRQPPETAAQSKIQNPKSKIDLETVEVPPPPAAVKPTDPRRSEPAKAEAPKPEAPKIAAKSEPASPRQPPVVAEKRQAVPAEDRSAASVTAPPADSRNPKGLVNGRTYVGEVVIPEGGKVTLEGIVWSETNPIVLVNGKVLPPGAIVEEFTITSIQPDRIELKGRGVTIYLALK